MKEIKRDKYLEKLIKKDGNGQIKVITGLRRSGKSYLLKNIFYNYLLQYNDKDHVLYIPLDTKENSFLRDGFKFIEYVKTKLIDDKKFYLLIDEVQLLDDFVSVLNTYLYMDNVEVYVTGSNARLLSKDIVTEFRGRGDVIHVYPLSFSEYYNECGKDKYEAYKEYSLYGGLPFVLSFDNDNDKSKYLKELFNETYINDILERNNISNVDELNELLNVVSSQIGFLTNPHNLENVFKSKKKINLSDKTISKYLDYLIDAFIINKVERYDVKGKKFINSPFKYYFEDVGLRNARLNFRQLDDGHIMENIIYNELVRRGFNVDIGVVNKEGKEIKDNVEYEVDFVCNLGFRRVYVQVAYNLGDPDKDLQERKSLININDSFKKIIVVGDASKPTMDDYGIITMGIYYFLLNEDSLDVF